MTAVVLAQIAWVARLPAVNALLNLTAAILLCAGYRFIRTGREQAHKRCMLAAFITSILFLTCYLIYHAVAGHVPFVGPPVVRTSYLIMLSSHVILAALVPLLAIVTIYLGLTNRRLAHRRWARWTLPIWLYVSVTGVLIYLVLYHLYPSSEHVAKIAPLADSIHESPTFGR